MARVAEERIYTLFFDDRELNNLNNGNPFTIEMFEKKVIVKRSGISYNQD